jgi:signal transduction histidine kinase/ketosteroid isomerase-like protein
MCGGGDTVPGVSPVSTIVDRFYAAFNARDLDTWIGLLDDDVQITVDAGRFRGRGAARVYAEGIMRTYPGVVAGGREVVAESVDTVVSEFQLVNPAAEAGPPDGPLADEAWRLDGLVCEVVRVRDDRIVALNSYYSATETDRTDIALVPSRAEAARIAQEQAALREVATLVARGVSQDELFAVVNKDLARLVDADVTSLFRFEPDDTMTLLAVWGLTTVPSPIGERRALDPELRAVRDTGRPTRFESAELPAAGPFVDESRRIGIASAVGVPIVVDGRVWGISFAASLRPDPFAADTEARIAGFTELVATALANAQARTELQALADQQTALRRVAELVARGPALDEVFTAVAVEASALLGGAAAALQRYDSDDVAVVVAACNSPAPLGLRVPVHAGTATGDVRRTGRPTRTDAYEGTALADLARRFGVVAAAVVPVTVEGRVWGNLSTSSSGPPIPSGTEDRLMPFAELAGVAIANAANKAKLTASRARVVATADETRRRLQRDVHDSAQQRLVHTVMTLKLARNALTAGHDVVDLIDEALRNAERANSELRDVVRGILPAALVRGGLRAGLESLTGDLVLPVDVRVDAPRLPVHVETTAYFIVAEALTNVTKHARATRATVEVDSRTGMLTIDVRDDGVGGADPARGTGLVGLLDRVEAGDGTLTVTSPAGRGTTVHAELLLGPTSP